MDKCTIYLGNAQNEYKNRKWFDRFFGILVGALLASAAFVAVIHHQTRIVAENPETGLELHEGDFNLDLCLQTVRGCQDWAKGQTF